MKAIAIANQKGGVGKTTTAKETAQILAEGGWRVLAIDMDGQHDLTNFYLDDRKPEATITDVFSKEVEAKDAILSTEHEGLDLIAADDRAYAMGEQNVTALAMTYLLETISDSYDFVVVDFPRIVSQATIAALVACDVVVIPTEASRASAEAAEATLNTLEAIDGPQASILITKLNARTTIAKQYLRLIEEMAKRHSSRLYRSRISFATAVPEAEGYGLSLSEHKPKSRPAQDYRNYLLELLGMFVAS